jgi:uncharacterized protein (TIGR02466 family)
VNINVKRVDTYATPIWIVELENLKQHQQKMIDRVIQLRAEASSDIKQKSNRNGWHSDLKILEEEEFKPLKANLVDISRTVFDDYGIDPKDGVFSVAGWANVHDFGGYNVSHVHPGSWLSGSFYLKVPEGAGKLFFDDPRAALRMEHVPLKDKNLLSKDPVRSRGKFYVTPRDMLLVLFPAWLEHGVEDCKCDQRISIAFNVTPVQIRTSQLAQLMDINKKK